MSDTEPGISGLFSRVFTLPTQAMDQLQQAFDLIPRAARLIDLVEQVVARAAGAVTAVELTIDRANSAVDATALVVEQAAVLVDRTNALVDGFEPSLQTLRPIVEKLAATTDPDEVDAAVRMINLLPELVDKVQADIVPILDTLGTVAPDLRDILDIAREVNEMMGSVPGLRGVKKRVEEQQQAEADYRADEEPPSAPKRRRRTAGLGSVSDSSASDFAAPDPSITGSGAAAPVEP